MQSAFGNEGPLVAATVKASSIGQNNAVLLHVEVSDGGEASPEVPVHGSIGVSCRPLDPTDDGAAEVICARADDGLPVLAARDLRLEEAAGTLEKGTVRIAGYHGARVSIEVQDASTSLVFVRGSDLRVPETDIVQGDPNTARDVALAQPLVEVLVELSTAINAIGTALNSLAPGSVNLVSLNLKLAPYLVPGSPSAPTTRAPGLKGEPGA